MKSTSSGFNRNIADIAKHERNAALAIGAAIAITFVIIAQAACSRGQANSNLKTNTSSPVSASITPAAPAAPVGLKAPTPAHDATHRAELARFHNDDFGISLQYPWQYGFKGGHKLRLDGEEIQTSFVVPDGAKTAGVNLATIDIPAGYYDKTDFERAFLAVNVSSKLSQDECSQFAGLDSDDASKPTSTKLGDMEAVMLEQVDDDSTVRTYHTYQNGSCYEFILTLQTNDGADQNQQTKPVSRKQVFARLENMLATIEIEQGANAALAGTPPKGIASQKP